MKKIIMTIIIAMTLSVGLSGCIDEDDRDAIVVDDLDVISYADLEVKWHDNLYVFNHSGTVEKDGSVKETKQVTLGFSICNKDLFIDARDISVFCNFPDGLKNPATKAKITDETISVYFYKDGWRTSGLYAGDIPSGYNLSHDFWVIIEFSETGYGTYNDNFSHNGEIVVIQEWILNDKIKTKEYTLPFVVRT